MLTKFLWKVDSRLSVFSGRPTILFFRRTYFVIQAISLAYWWHWPLNEMSLNPNLIFLGRPGLPELKKLEKTEKRWIFLRYYFITLFLSLPIYAFTSNLSFNSSTNKIIEAQMVRCKSIFSNLRPTELAFKVIKSFRWTALSRKRNSRSPSTHICIQVKSRFHEVWFIVRSIMN